MTPKRKVEIFTAGCSACTDVVDLAKEVACSSCEVTVLDMNDAEIARRAKALGIRTVPSVVVNGKLLDCCVGGPTKEALQAAGIGVEQ